MEPEAKKYNAFTTPYEVTFQFNAMLFGLKGAPDTFQLLMNQEVLVGMINIYCLVYLDDVIIYSDTNEEHLQHLECLTV